jgi:hypothetical protein
MVAIKTTFRYPRSTSPSSEQCQQRIAFEKRSAYCIRALAIAIEKLFYRCSGMDFRLCKAFHASDEATAGLSPILVTAPCAHVYMNTMVIVLGKKAIKILLSCLKAVK